MENLAMFGKHQTWVNFPLVHRNRGSEVRKGWRKWSLGEKSGAVDYIGTALTKEGTGAGKEHILTILRDGDQ